MKKPDPLIKKLFERTLKQQARPVNHRLPGKSPTDSKNNLKPRIDCRKCAYFYITWEQSTPYGCRAHGFKAAQMPSHVVFASSGQHCLLFCRKPD
jgi:hypothetical protein